MKNEPAFPMLVEALDPRESKFYSVDGMSKRFYAACAALTGLMPVEGIDYYSRAVAAFKQADAMLKYEREHPEAE